MIFTAGTFTIDRITALDDLEIIGSGINSTFLFSNQDDSYYTVGALSPNIGNGSRVTSNSGAISTIRWNTGFPLTRDYGEPTPSVGDYAIFNDLPRRIVEVPSEDTLRFDIPPPIDASFRVCKGSRLITGYSAGATQLYLTMDSEHDVPVTSHVMICDASSSDSGNELSGEILKVLSATTNRITCELPYRTYDVNTLLCVPGPFPTVNIRDCSIYKPKTTKTNAKSIFCKFCAGLTLHNVRVFQVDTVTCKSFRAKRLYGYCAANGTTTVDVRDSALSGFHHEERGGRTRVVGTNIDNSFRINDNLGNTIITDCRLDTPNFCQLGRNASVLKSYVSSDHLITCENASIRSSTIGYPLIGTGSIADSVFSGGSSFVEINTLRL